MDIFYRRRAGQIAPCSDDPILNEYKFCNVYRALDRESQHLIRDVAYAPKVAPEDRLFQIVLYRFFSRWTTWQSLTKILSHAPTLADLASGELAKVLEEVRRKNKTLYTGAFILCATDAFGEGLKHRNHLALWRKMFVDDRLSTRLLRTRSFKEIYETLETYPLIGPFMAYQIAIDLNYSELINFSENDFTQPGPGALRGIRKAFQSLGGLTPPQIVLWMVEHQTEEFAKQGISFPGLFGRPLQAIDCQGLFCEFDKYCRVALPSLKSARSRIKQRYKPSTPLPELFLPPKWQLSY